MSKWQSLAIAEASLQGVEQDIVLATVEAETNGRNITGDNGNSLGYGQVQPRWHMRNFYAAGKELNINVPSDMTKLTQLVLGNDRYSMAVAVNTIKDVWNGSGKNWSKFTKSYVGAGISSEDFNRRYAIWAKYNSNEAYNQSAAEYVSIPQTNYKVVPDSKSKGNLLYGRKYRILISINSNTALDVSDLKCTFMANKTMMMQPNMSEIVIYNLSPETENSIIKEGYRIIIEAGYEGSQYGIIFDGQVIQPIREKEDGVSYKLTLTAIDGDRFINSGFINTTLFKGIGLREQIENCSSKAKYTSQIGSISETLSAAKLPRGKVLFGLARDYLRQIAQSDKATFYVEDGKVNIVKAADLPFGEVIELSPESGLLGMPTQTEFGMTAKCLMNPQIKPNTLVHIDNNLIKARQINSISEIYYPFDPSGLYRVVSCNYVGDTRGNDWYVEINTVTQSGYIPSMITDATLNPW